MRSLLLIAAIFLAPCVGAHADSFSFTYVGTGVSASGVLTTSSSNNGVYTITAISGQRNGMSITGLDTSFEGPDELLYYPATDTGNALTPTYLDNNGFSYDIGKNAYNIFTSFGRPTVVEGDSGLAVSFSVSPLATAATPEPSGIVLLGTGLLGAVGAIRKRLKQS